MNQEQKAFFKKFGAEVRKLRMAAELTLEDMQDYGFSSQHFQKVESGKKAVNLYTAHRIADSFKISLSKLLKYI